MASFPVQLQALARGYRTKEARIVRLPPKLGVTLMYLWLKSLHIISMVTWFAGLFYLPRLFVYHAQASDLVSIERFKVMERKLYRGITTPGGILTIGLGLGMVWMMGSDAFLAAGWLHLKLCAVVLLVLFHAYLGHLVKVFAIDANRRSHVFYRWLNELPVLILISAVCLAVFKPA